ncbi:hypothetical protein C8F01DRAFT_1091194 [Mycena amicta]|nr:hypothetical protein C8F01DRAFT_1091194 [Mycena amicta]
MAMEAVFFQVSFCCWIFECSLTFNTSAQIPSARNHARNFIAPFVDSLTSMLVTHFLMGIAAQPSARARARAARTLARARDSGGLSPAGSASLMFQNGGATLVNEHAITDSNDTEADVDRDDHGPGWFDFWTEDGPRRTRTWGV